MLDAAFARPGGQQLRVNYIQQQDLRRHPASRTATRLTAPHRAAAPGTAAGYSASKLKSAKEQVDARDSTTNLPGEKLDTSASFDRLVIVIDDPEHLQAVPGGARLPTDLLAARIDRLLLTTGPAPTTATATRGAFAQHRASDRARSTRPGPHTGGITTAAWSRADGRRRKGTKSGSSRPANRWPLGAALAAPDSDNPATAKLDLTIRAHLVPRRLDPRIAA